MLYARPLLATDLSDAARTAARLAPRFLTADARGRAVLVLPYPDLPMRTPREVREDVNAAIEDRRARGEGVLREWLRAEGMTAFEPEVLYGAVARMLAREAETADVVILGATGASRLERVMLGSVARGVLRRVSCDVLIVRPGEGMRTIMLATDLQAPGQDAARAAAALASSTGARVQLLHVIEPGFGAVPYSLPEESSDDWRTIEKYALDGIQRLDRDVFGGTAEQRIVHDRITSGIIRAARDAPADLVVVGSHGDGIASRVLLGSVAESVAEHAPCSVLIVRPRRTAMIRRVEGKA